MMRRFWDGMGWDGMLDFLPCEWRIYLFVERAARVWKWVGGDEEMVLTWEGRCWLSAWMHGCVWVSVCGL